MTVNIMISPKILQLLRQYDVCFVILILIYSVTSSEQFELNVFVLEVIFTYSKDLTIFNKGANYINYHKVCPVFSELSVNYRDSIKLFK